ncbi:MAG: hypothetical protein COB54_07060 [Alphaproteobacteria bacterium]|nr:MAG: hypothetical protein COB54_07060 [Alphaproteobacteria bacterium]
MNGLVAPEEDQAGQPKHRPVVILAWISLMVALVLSGSVYLWQTSRNDQLSKLKERATRNLSLQRSKIQEELGYIDLSLLPVLGHHPVVEHYLAAPTASSGRPVQKYLDDIVGPLSNRATFVGSSGKFILASPTYDADHAMIKKILPQLAARAFKGKNSQMLLFSETAGASRFIMVTPLLTQDKINGYIGILLDLTDVQNRMAKSLTAPEEIVVVSDPRGIIMLSSNPQWLHRTFSPLPYGVKKTLYDNFEQQGLFRPLGIANIDQDIITLAASEDSLSDQSYLVQSVMLKDYPLRLHHLSTIAPVERTSALHVAMALTCFILAVLLVLLIREKRTLVVMEKGHQDRLRESEAHKHQIIEATASGLITFHFGGRIASLNHAAQTLIGGPLSDGLSHVSHLFVQPHMAQKVSQPGAKDIDQSFETLVLKRDQTSFPVQASIKPMGFGEPPLYLLTLIDISDKKNTEAELEQHQKMAAMGMMATTLAHEISQPITSIKTEATIGKKYLDQGNGEETRQSLETILDYTKLLARITAQLKSFARRNKTSRSARANVYQAIQYSHILYQHRLKEERITWHETITDHGLCARIDDYQLQQVVGNLIQNACDALKDGDEKNISVEVRAENDEIFIEISDSGPGIRPEVQASIFEPFVSSKKTPSSVGLGLAICKDILTRAGGHIEVMDSGRGAKFRITLPAVGLREVKA